MTDTFGGQLAEVMADDDLPLGDAPIVWEDEKGPLEAEAEEATLAGMGHNQPPEPLPEVEPLLPAMDLGTSTTAQGRLRTIVERLERLHSDKDDLAADMKEVYLEAKGEGFDTKIIRKVIALRRQDKAKRQEEEAMIDLYTVSIGDA